MPYSDAEMLRLARRSLEIEDDPDAPIPDFYLPHFQAYLSTSPLDTNFILELATKGGGGRGFGTATCMEDYCWKDIVLGADPSIPDGGKKRGFGSFWEYQIHCQDAEHEKGRDERCNKQGILAPAPSAAVATPAVGQPSRAISPQLPTSTYTASSSSSAIRSPLEALLPSSLTSSSRHIPEYQRPFPIPRSQLRPPVSHPQSSPIAGPSRLPASSSSSRSHASPLPSSPTSVKAKRSADKSLSEINQNVPLQRTAPSASGKDIKPTAGALQKSTSGGNRGEPILVLSDSDSDVEELSGDRIPEYMRKVTNQNNPYILDDDDEDEEEEEEELEELELPTSSRSGPSSSLPNWADRLKESLNMPPPLSSSNSRGRAAQVAELQRPPANWVTPPPMPGAWTGGANAPSDSASNATSANTAPDGIVGEPLTHQLQIRYLQAEIDDVKSKTLIRTATYTKRDGIALALKARSAVLATKMRQLVSAPHAFQYLAAREQLRVLYPSIKNFADLFSADAVRRFQKIIGQTTPLVTLREMAHRHTSHIPPVNYQLPSTFGPLAPASSAQQSAPIATTAASASRQSAMPLDEPGGQPAKSTLSAGGITGEPMNDQLRAAKLQAEKVEVEFQITKHLRQGGDADYIFDELRSRRSQLDEMISQLNTNAKSVIYKAASVILRETYPSIASYAELFAADTMRRWQNLYPAQPASSIRDLVIQRVGCQPPDNFQLPVRSGAASALSAPTVGRHRTTQFAMSLASSDVQPIPSGITGDPMSVEMQNAKLKAEIKDVELELAARRIASGPMGAYVAHLKRRRDDLRLLRRKLKAGMAIDYLAPNGALLGRYPQWKAYADLWAAHHFRKIQLHAGPRYPLSSIRNSVQKKVGYAPPVNFQLPVEPRSATSTTSNAVSPSSIAGPSNLNRTLSTIGSSYHNDLASLEMLSSSRSSRHFGVYPNPGEDGYDSETDPYLEYRFENPLKQGEELKDYFQETVDGWQDDADIDGALKKLGLNTIEDRFSEMTVRLMPHQCLGVSWMLEKEKDEKYKGGLLCDAMGLGKTVQMIATIVGNPSEDKKVKTTLVVAPLALLSQWKAEIESKTTAGLLSVVIHYGPGKVKSVARLKNYDVVLTTYGTLVSEMGNEDKLELANKRKKQKRNRAAADGGEDAWEMDESEEEVEMRRREKGPLFKIQWYRVVLDEAHTIRNRNTRMALACCTLEAVHRWSLTGTLIVNTLDDLQTQLRFTGISPCQNLQHYQNHIGRLQKSKPRLATKRAQAILRNCMMRRHKDSTLNGRKLLELPPKTSQVETIDFSEEERSIYDLIEKKMQLKFTNFLERGTVLKHMSCILVMLLRLRQLCNHPWLLRRNPGDPAHPDDFTVSDEDLFANLEPPPAEDPEELQRAIRVMGQAWVDDVAAKIQKRREKLENAAKRDEEAEKDNECAICLDMMQDEVVVNCKHSFCRGCVSEIFTNPPRDEDEMTDDQVQRGARKCPLCRGVIEKEKVFAAGALIAPKEAEVGSSDDVDRKGKRRADEVDGIADTKLQIKRVSLGSDKSRKGKGKAKEEDEEMGSLDRVLPSTKMKHLSGLLQEFLAKGDDKVIVFSQFTTFLDLVANHLRSEGIPYELYIGPMNRHLREDAVRRFSAPIKDERSPRVMLISLKCGGVGLNLTAASKVISLDLAWNTATEEQAFDRAHRIGQTKPVDVRRVVINNTIEQRILQLQEAKKALADGAMGEGDGGKLGRLSVGDLIKLFNVDTENLHED